MHIIFYEKGREIPKRFVRVFIKMLSLKNVNSGLAEEYLKW
jgi:hypothetical protein